MQYELDLDNSDDEVYCDVCGTHYTTEDPCPFH